VSGVDRYQHAETLAFFRKGYGCFAANGKEFSSPAADCRSFPKIPCVSRRFPQFADPSLSSRWQDMRGDITAPTFGRPALIRTAAAMLNGRKERRTGRPL
jgi:hypothetical protein